LTTCIYLAHLNPVTNAHVEIIEEQKKENNVVVMPVRFLKGEKEINSNRKEYLMAIKTDGKTEYKPILGLSTDRYVK